MEDEGGLASSREPQRRVRRRNEVPDNRLRLCVCLNEPANRQMPPDRSPEHAGITPIPARFPAELSTEPPRQFLPPTPPLASSLRGNYRTFVPRGSRASKPSPDFFAANRACKFAWILFRSKFGFYFPLKRRAREGAVNLRLEPWISSSRASRG